MTPNVQPANRQRWKKKWVFAAIFIIAVFSFFQIYNRYLTPEKITTAESTLRAWYASSPLTILLMAFLIYTLATGLSLPIATVLSLSYAWILGWAAIPVLNLAATCGATLAFLSARFLFHDWVQNRFAENLQVINRGFQRDGVYYVIFLRMVAVFPYVVVNLVLGVVPIRTRSYFLATMIGMLPLNCAFVYLGRQIPSTTEILDQGIQSLISWQIILGISMIGVLPLILRHLLSRLSRKATSEENRS